MLEFGNKNRTQHPTDANAESSRSHAVFQVENHIIFNFCVEFFPILIFFSSPVGSLCHTRGIVRRSSSVVCRLCPP